jgi:hypothetical protein
MLEAKLPDDQAELLGSLKLIHETPLYAWLGTKLYVNPYSGEHFRVYSTKQKSQFHLVRLADTTDLEFSKELYVLNSYGSSTLTLSEVYSELLKRATSPGTVL